MISGSWIQAPHQVPPWVGSLLEIVSFPLSLSAPPPTCSSPRWGCRSPLLFTGRKKAFPFDSFGVGRVSLSTTFPSYCRTRPSPWPTIETLARVCSLGGVITKVQCPHDQQMVAGPGLSGQACSALSRSSRFHVVRWVIWTCVHLNTSSVSPQIT